MIPFPFQAGQSGIATPDGDPYYGNVKLLLHGDGSNGLTTFTDNSTVPKNPSVFGNAQISTAQSKFGGASMLFDGTGDYISYADSADWFSTTKTIEMWVRPVAVGSLARICGQGTSAGGNAVGGIAITAENKFQYFEYNGSAHAIALGTTIVAANTWYFVEATWDGTNIRLFVNGVLEATTAATFSFNSTEPFAIGRQGSYDTEYFNGYIDDFRYTKDIARHTAGFTPPIAPHPNLK